MNYFFVNQILGGGGEGKEIKEKISFLSCFYFKKNKNKLKVFKIYVL